MYMCIHRFLEFIKVCICVYIIYIYAFLEFFFLEFIKVCIYVYIIHVYMYRCMCVYLGLECIDVCVHI